MFFRLPVLKSHTPLVLVASSVFYSISLIVLCQVIFHFSFLFVLILDCKYYKKTYENA